MSEQPENDTDEPDPGSSRDLVVGLAIAVEGGLFAAAWLLGGLADVPVLSRLTFDWLGLLWGVLATLPMLAMFFAVWRWPVGPLRSIKQFTDDTIRPMMAPCSLVDLAGISLLAGLGEEVLFRGLIQEVWAGWVGVPVAIVIAATLFGLMHAMTPTYALLAALIGAYLGLVFRYSDNLLAAVVAHALYDFVALVWVTRGPGSGQAEESPRADP